MLKKLIKYDLKYGVRIFAILHAVLIISCLLIRFLVIDHLDFSADPKHFAPAIAILIVILTMLFSTISFGCCIMYAVRFYKNLFTDEVCRLDTSGISPHTTLGKDFFGLHLVYTGSCDLLWLRLDFDRRRKCTVCFENDLS